MPFLILENLIFLKLNLICLKLYPQASFERARLAASRGSCQVFKENRHHCVAINTTANLSFSEICSLSRKQMKVGGYKFKPNFQVSRQNSQEQRPTVQRTGSLELEPVQSTFPGGSLSGCQECLESANGTSLPRCNSTGKARRYEERTRPRGEQQAFPTLKQAKR